MRSTLSRVGSSKIEKKSSSSGPTASALALIVAPSASSRDERPRTSSTYFSPSAERGRILIVESSGTGVADVSSCSVSCAPSPGARHGRDPRDLPDAEAALADLVADDEARGVRHVDADLLDRDERQPAVGLVGEQHGGDEHEHRDGADEDRVRGDRARAAAGHGPRR